jgi:glycosyltransferase involved in cell wall biosynthesis
MSETVHPAERAVDLVKRFTCGELVGSITAYLDDVLDQQERAGMEAHLACCEACERYVEQFRTTIRLVGRLGEEDLEPHVRDALLEAFRDVPGELVLVGEGTDAARLRDLAGPRVRFEGSKDRDALVADYARADVFVLPSRSEPWGMVLNEAASAGLPLVATEESGAAHDLIENGVNGFRVSADDVGALRECLTRLAQDRELRARAGSRSRELAGRFTPAAWADGVATLASAAVRR